jgi:hypothetical protein
MYEWREAFHATGTPEFTSVAVERPIVDITPNQARRLADWLNDTADAIDAEKGER